MLMHPVNGLIGHALRAVGLRPIDWLADWPLTSIVIIVSWQWLPYATLVLLTALQSLDPELKEAARMDGAGPLAMFLYIILPHLGRAISVVVMVETIFLLSVFAEIFVTTSGGPGLATTNLAFLIYRYAMLEYDIGGASAGGVIAIVLANVVAFFLVRTVAATSGRPGQGRRHEASPAAQADRHGPRLAGGRPDVLPDLLDAPDRVQDRGRRPVAAPVLPAHPGELRRGAGAGELPAVRREQRRRLGGLDAPALWLWRSRPPTRWRSSRPGGRRACCSGCSRRR